MDTNNDNKFETVSFEEVKQALGKKGKELDSFDAWINFKNRFKIY